MAILYKKYRFAYRFAYLELINNTKMRNEMKEYISLKNTVKIERSRSISINLLDHHVEFFR